MMKCSAQKARTLFAASQSLKTLHDEEVLKKGGCAVM
jgi:hypothetical protein